MSNIAGLILAGGRSSRMGSDKALLLFEGRPILERLLEAYEAARLRPLIVVASAAVEQAFHGRPGLRLVPSDPSGPMIDSVARGLEAIGDAATAAIIQPVDAPYTSPEMIALLTQGARHAARVLCHRGVPGHPVLLPRARFADVAERPDGGLRAVLAETEVELVEWATPEILADLDTPADLAALGGPRLH